MEYAAAWRIGDSMVFSTDRESSRRYAKLLTTSGYEVQYFPTADRAKAWIEEKEEDRLYLTLMERYGTPATTPKGAEHGLRHVPH